MKNFVFIFAIVHVIAAVILLVLAAIANLIFYGLAFVLTLIPTFILSDIIQSHAWNSYKRKYNNALEELDNEKNAYEETKKELEATSLMLGQILIEKKENY